MGGVICPLAMAFVDVWKILDNMLIANECIDLRYQQSAG